MVRNTININNNHLYIQLVIIVVIVIYFTGYMRERYYPWMPTIPVYPDNTIEAAEVANLVNKGDQYYINLFLKTDRSVSDAFKEIVNIDIETLDNMIMSPQVLFVIMGLKIIINRARPHQIDKRLNIQHSISSHTPAYPSGHCIQAYYLAKHLSLQYPERTNELYKLAEDCATARVYAGLHYPSDNQFGKWIALNIL